MPINQYFNRFPFDKAVQNIDQYKADVEKQLRVEAKEFNHEVADYMQKHFKRKGDSTGRLVTATLDSRNAVFGAATWRSPNVQFLSQSQAKYWRLIEQGSAGLYAHGRGFRGTPLYFLGDGAGRPFRSVSRGGEQGPYLANGSFRARGRIRFVSHEIEPMHAYAITYAEGNWPARMRREFKEIARVTFKQ